MRSIFAIGSVLVLAMLLVTGPGCRRPKGEPTAGGEPTQRTPPPAVTRTPQPQPAPPQAGGGGGGAGNAAQMSLRRKVDQARAAGHLLNLAKYYQIYSDTNGSPPSSGKQMADYVRREAPPIAAGIDEGFLVVVPNVRPGSGSIVAYESIPDTGGVHWAAMNDGAVQKLTTAQLQAALQGR